MQKRGRGGNWLLWPRGPPYQVIVSHVWWSCFSAKLLRCHQISHKRQAPYGWIQVGILSLLTLCPKTSPSFGGHWPLFQIMIFWMTLRKLSLLRMTVMELIRVVSGFEYVSTHTSEKENKWVSQESLGSTRIISHCHCTLYSVYLYTVLWKDYRSWIVKWMWNSLLIKEFSFRVLIICTEELHGYFCLPFSIDNCWRVNVKMKYIGSQVRLQTLGLKRLLKIYLLER